MSIFKKNLLLILAAVIIVVVPLIFLQDAEFAGADGLAEEAITEIDPDYVPWFDSLIELPSGEIESLLFCVQAAIGSGVVCFILGRMTAKPERQKEETDKTDK